MRLYVPITRQEFDALRQIALAERRRPQDQAAVLLGAVLRERASGDLTMAGGESDRGSSTTFPAGRRGDAVSAPESTRALPA